MGKVLRRAEHRGKVAHLVAGELSGKHRHGDRFAGLHAAQKLAVEPREHARGKALRRRQGLALRRARIEIQYPDQAFLRARRARIVVSDGALRGLRRLCGTGGVARFPLFRVGNAAAAQPFGLLQHRLARYARLFRHARGVYLALDRARERREKRGSAFQIVHAPLVGRGRVFGFHVAQPVFDLARARVDQIAESVRAVLLDELVRVLRARHLQNAHLEIELFENADGARRRLPARLVAVVAEDDLVRIARNEPRLLARERRAERGDRAVEPRLVQGDDVNVAFYENDIPVF